jgi:hypothetical protein
MNAQQARAIASSSGDKTVEKTLGIIILKIKEAATYGKFAITDSRIIEKLNSYEEKSLILELEKLGYKISIREYVGDYWGDGGGKVLTVSWG